MANSGAGSADLQEKKETDDVNDTSTDHNHGKKTLSLGVQTPTSRGDTDQTAAVQKEKRSRKEIDKKYNDKKKTKLENYNQISKDLEIAKGELEYLKKLVELKDQDASEKAIIIQTLQSQASLFLGGRANEIQHTLSLSRMLERAQVRADALERENEYLRSMIQQQPGDMMVQQQPEDMMVQQQPEGMVQQQPEEMIQQQPEGMIQQPEEMIQHQLGEMIQQLPGAQQDDDNVDADGFIDLSGWDI